jgi:hypothetical protein
MKGKINSKTKWILIFLGIVFLLGLTFCLNPSITKESMSNMLSGEVPPPPLEQPPLDNPTNPTCPNLLIRSGAKILLYNTNVAQSESNPLVFEHLDNYLMFLQEQRKKGIRCPVLFLQEENNTQGQTVDRMRPNPMEMQGGLPIQPVQISDSSDDNPPFNQNQYSGFDSHNFHEGEYTVLDQIHDSTAKVKISDNPMDSNWGGVEYSRQAVESGKYADREVGKQTMIPKVVEIYK